MKRKNGFTLIELLVVIGIIAILAAMLLPVLAKAQARTYAAYCMNDCKQLQVSLLQYTHDFNDNFIPIVNGSGAGTTTGGGQHSWVSGWLDWTSTDTENTNTFWLTDDRYAMISPYLGKSKNVFHCPADKFVAGPQKNVGWQTRCRSLSCDAWLGGGSPGGFGGIYQPCARVSDVKNPGPSDTYSYLDEHPDSINDAAFFAPDKTTEYVDVPATYHNFACGFAFVDGHAEIHKWMASMKTYKAVSYAAINFANPPGVSGTDQDIFWLSYHAPRTPVGAPF